MAKYVFLYVPAKFAKRHAAVAWYKLNYSEDYNPMLKMKNQIAGFIESP